MTMLRTHFYWGERSQLAKRSGVTRNTITKLFKKRRGVSPALAKRIYHQAREMGLDVSLLDIIYPEDSINPLFSADEVEE